MTVPFIAASLLLAIATLAYVLRPLWQPRWWVGGAMSAMLLTLTGLLYTQVGTPRALDPAELRAPDTLAEAITRLEAELQREPEQGEGWRLLAKAYAADSRAVDANRAYTQALKYFVDDAELHVEAAQARAMTSEGRRFDEIAVAQLQRALTLQPMHQRARWFLGIAQRQAGQPAQAAKTWEPLLGMVEAQTAPTLRDQINAARAEAGQPPLPAPAAVAAGPVISVTVAVAPQRQATLPDNATLFVIARQADGTPIPVAVRKQAARDFPITLTLSDADSLMPTLKLSQLSTVELTARISIKGDAKPQPGDIEAAKVLVPMPSTTPVTITLDRVVE